MEYRYHGSSGLQISAISLGSWVTLSHQMGEDLAYEITTTAFDASINFFDNSETYGYGKSESVMGSVFKKAGWKRSEFIVSTKVFWLIVCLLAALSGCSVFKPLNVLDQDQLLGDAGTPPSELELNPANYPRMDGSSSTFPLSMLISCHFLQLPCVWTDWLDGTRVLLPDVTGYQGEFPEINHHGTHASYENLINREADLILVARLPSNDELNLARLSGVELEAIPIALDAFVFVLNIENPIDDLSMEEIRQIYTGKLTHWNELGGNDASIQPYRRNDNSGSEELMRELVMQGQSTIELPENLITSMVALIDQVSLDPNGIGYSVYYYEQFIAPKENLRLMGVDGIIPSEETIRNRSYPFTTEVYAVIRKDLSKANSAYKLRNWLLSDEGQAVVAESGYAPIK